MEREQFGWNNQIYGYCERGFDPGFWAEPLNAVTNIAFILGGLFCLMAARRAELLDGVVRYLCILMCVIGVGSFLFHTFATPWAALMDTGPILLFILSYFTIAVRRYVGLSYLQTALATVLYIFALGALSYVFRLTLTPYLGSSTSYMPALIAIYAMGIYLRHYRHPAANGLILAGIVFAVSLNFRLLDGSVCDGFKFGTHFLWHLLNAAVLTILVVTVMVGGRVTTRKLAAERRAKRTAAATTSGAGGGGGPSDDRRLAAKEPAK